MASGIGSCSSLTSQSDIANNIFIPGSARSRDIGLCQVDGSTNKANKYIMNLTIMRNFQDIIFLGHINGEERWQMGLSPGVMTCHSLLWKSIDIRYYIRMYKLYKLNTSRSKFVVKSLEKKMHDQPALLLDILRALLK